MKKLSADESGVLMNLEKELAGRVIGQTEATRYVIGQAEATRARGRVVRTSGLLGVYSLLI
eukprot:6856206-Pyramimonas_sp.AAC.1